MDTLSRVKSLLGLSGNERDDLLTEIISLTESRFLNLLGTTEIPKELLYIVVEVSIIRYNRIGSEGVSSHSVGGETMSFHTSDFDPYLEDIENYKTATRTTERMVHFY